MPWERKSKNKKKVKHHTTPGRKKLLKAKEQGNKEIKEKILALFPELNLPQIQDTLNAGIDVTIHKDISAKALMDILKY